jgi:methylmalonyl-CoA carboxyltransferase 12S subunit
MKMKDLAETLEKLQVQLAALSDRMELLEAAVLKPKEKASAMPAPKPAPRPEPAKPAKPEFTEEDLIAISAALGAYLGFRVHIKQIRLLSSPAWAQQGRVSIQASHKLHN